MKKNFKRMLMGMILALSLCVTSVVPTFAASNNEVVTRAGSETWVPGVHDVGDFNMTDTNLTPRKTMGASGHLIVYGAFSR